MRPLAPFGTPPRVRLDGMPLLVIDGEEDERRSPGDGLLVANQLEQLGATVTHHVIATGHLLTDEDRRLARGWFLDAGPEGDDAARGDDPRPSVVPVAGVLH